jgi:uncharacterized protein DUF4153
MNPIRLCLVVDIDERHAIERPVRDDMASMTSGRLVVGIAGRPPRGHRLLKAQRTEVQAQGQAPHPHSSREMKVMSIATTSDFEIAPARPLVTPLVLAAGCVALADWLFFGWAIGISLALFLGVLGVVAVAGNGVRAARKTRIIMSAVFVAGLLPLVEYLGILSAILGTLATGLFVIVITAEEPASWQQYLFDVAIAPFRGPFQLAADLIRHMKRQNYGWLKLDSLIAWIIPLGIFTIFVWLFASANPLIERGLLQIDIRELVSRFDPVRVAFWALLAGVIWPFIFCRSERNAALLAEISADFAHTPSDLNYLLGTKATLRSLILFNALFALQSGLDLTYLWGGANLPDGMNHAEYAHRGAYPLIVTALLAAGFVLIAMRPGGPAEKSMLIRPLVLLWIGQNILLVISSIFRLDLYVAAFSLTYLRLAAFIWMVLVAAGLLLILIQILLRKPNSWLVSANAATLALVLYGCCFINAPWLVAAYNVEHCREIGGTGPNLDLQYLASLGQQALPALDRHRKEVPALVVAMDLRFPHARDFFAHSENWREWSFRTWRLKRDLANNPPIPLNASDSGKG